MSRFLRKLKVTGTVVCGFVTPRSPGTSDSILRGRTSGSGVLSGTQMAKPKIGKHNKQTRYGRVHRITDFIERTIPERGQGRFDALFVHNVIAFLKRLDSIQMGNYGLTLHFQTGDEIRAFHQGQLAFSLMPALQHIRLIIGRQWEAPAVRYIVRAIAKRRKAYEGFANTKHGKTHFQWLLDANDTNIFYDILKGLKQTDASLSLSTVRHPRGFPGELRQAALDAFIADGNWCPGIVGRKKHRVNFSAGQRIEFGQLAEFDHILPHARGGSNSISNIQVLCSECNHAKSEKAI